MQPEAAPAPRSNLGWIGDPHQVVYVLGVVGADRDDQGNFMIFGEPIVFGIDGDCVIPEGSEYTVGGKRCKLAALLADTSYGHKVQVY